MTPKERINSVLKNNKPDKVPFVPAIYEHKAALINKSPSDVCRNKDLLYESLLAEYEIYSPDILTVGIDVYNIEAEAIGCKIKYSDDNEVPIIEKSILEYNNLADLKIPDPEKDGRMPIILETARRVNDKFGEENYIAVGISGPFSLAASLMGQENLLITMIEYPEFINEVMQFCKEVIKKYIIAIKECGTEIVIFDSAAAPPMISPKQFNEFDLPVLQEIFLFMKDLKFNFLSYIIGGNTLPILDSILKTGANNILCDFNANLEQYLNKVKPTGITIRKNISPSLITFNSDEEIRKETQEILNIGKQYNGFILGTGILPYNTDPEKVNLMKALL